MYTQTNGINQGKHALIARNLIMSKIDIMFIGIDTYFQLSRESVLSRKMTFVHLFIFFYIFESGIKVVMFQFKSLRSLNLRKKYLIILFFIRSIQRQQCLCILEEEQIKLIIRIALINKTGFRGTGISEMSIEQ